MAYLFDPSGLCCSSAYIIYSVIQQFTPNKSILCHCSHIECERLFKRLYDIFTCFFMCIKAQFSRLRRVESMQINNNLVSLHLGQLFTIIWWKCIRQLWNEKGGIKQSIIRSFMTFNGKVHLSKVQFWVFFEQFQVLSPFESQYSKAITIPIIVLAPKVFCDFLNFAEFWQLW